MRLVGTVIKETTKLGAKYASPVKSPSILVQNQTKQLECLLKKAQKTALGKRFDFKKILQSGSVETCFRETVPMYTYETFYEEWLTKVLNDHPDVIWPGNISYFALSSGTTKSASKRIPVSKDMIKQFHKTALQQLSTVHQFNFPAKFYSSSVLTIGGSTSLSPVKDHFEGDLSGILQRTKPFFLRGFSKPGTRTSKIVDWEDKMNAIVKKAPFWDVGVIAGVPSWIAMLLQKIVSHYELNNIHEIWPNLSLYLHGGVFLENYEKRILSMCKKPIHFLNTYLASEGYFAHQVHPHQPGMKLLLNHGVYYEFVEDIYFEQLANGKQLSSIPTLNLSQVEKNKNYAIVISNSSGLWRYVLGDVIRFIDLEQFTVDITGRIAHTMNVMGEHLSLENMNKAINATAQKLGVEVAEFCLTTTSQMDRHLWYIGSKQLINEQLFSVYLNTELERLNDDYCSLRKMVLRSPRVKALPEEKFYEFMERKGKLGAQHKFPRVLSAQVKKEWETFLCNPVMTYEEI